MNQEISKKVNYTFAADYLGKEFVVKQLINATKLLEPSKEIPK